MRMRAHAAQKECVTRAMRRGVHAAAARWQNVEAGMRSESEVIEER